MPPNRPNRSAAHGIYRLVQALRRLPSSSEQARTSILTATAGLHLYALAAARGEALDLVAGEPSAAAEVANALVQEAGRLHQARTARAANTVLKAANIYRRALGYPPMRPIALTHLPQGLVPICPRASSPA